MDRWERIEHAYHGARDLSGAERARFIEDHCGADAEMRQQVEVLLAQDRTPNSLLNRPIVDVSAAWRSNTDRWLSLIGRTIGPYQVVAHVGSGGMGDVYRAHDTKLNREVALKVLPDAFALDPVRLARFKREAQVLASLNHPGIAAIYGFEDSDGTPALVLEYVDGPTVGDRIALGPLTVDEAVQTARQIGEALEAAHERGIIHRDLKPANIKLRPDGVVKILDFGLAKALLPTTEGDATPAVDGSGVTQAGVILGTPAYMSPEQTRGRPADKRCDVWAFGCVLYEMLSGRRAFPGDDEGDTLTAIRHGAPDWTALPPATPPRIRSLIEGCLDRDRKTRIADASTVRFLLTDRHDAVVTALPTSASGATVSRLIAIAGYGLVGAAIAALTWFLRPSPSPSPSPPITRFAIIPAVPITPRPPYRDIDISPDGTRIVYNTGINPVATDLWVRAIDSIEATKLQGVDTPKAPFFSSDGQWIGFYSGGELRKVPVHGGSPSSICRIEGVPLGATWGARNTIVFASDLLSGLWTVSANGGEPSVLTTPNPADGEIDHRFPSFLPGGDAVLFTVTTKEGIDRSRVAVMDLKTGRRKTLIRGGRDAHYVDTGHLICASGGALNAVAFDPAGLKVLDEPVRVVENVLSKPSGAADFSVSSHGTLVYVPGAVETPRRTLVWVDRRGHEERINAPPRAYVYPRLSPDGTRVALDIRDQGNDIWILDLVHEGLSRVTTDPATDSAPVWTPDGQDIIFASTRSGEQNLYRQRADASSPPTRLTESHAAQFPLSISPDGTQLVVRQEVDDIHTYPVDLFILHLNRPAPSRDQTLTAPLTRPFRTTVARDNGTISPDGHWLAYESSESTHFEVYVSPFPDVDRARWPVSNAGGRAPAWSANGRELFYLDGNGLLTEVPINTSGPAFGFGKPTRLLSSTYYAVNIRTYDVSGDGQRFLMIKDTEGRDKPSPSSRIEVVQNLFDNLQRRTATK